MLLIVPSDPMNPTRPDEHWEPEAGAAREVGADVAVIDHDAIIGGDLAQAVRRVRVEGVAAYRGWMLSPPQYEALANELTTRGVVVRTTPEQYRTAHELPGWYSALAGLTPVTVWTDSSDAALAVTLLGQLPPGSAVVKDYVKSMKHYWNEACFIPDTRDPVGAEAVIRRFVDLRGPEIEGGIVLRQYEQFTKPEVRTWWRNGRPFLAAAHPDTPDAPPPIDVPVAQFGDAIFGLGLSFVTADLVRRDDGEWRIVEIGDGQVSDRPTSLPPLALIAPLLAE